MLALRLAVLLSVAALVEPARAAEAPDEEFYDPPVVTPTGQPTRISEAPSATYVISGDELRRAGADTLPELLRRVAGLDVRRLAASDGQLGPRGFGLELADRVLVMIDGRTVFIDFFGGTVYELLPISPIDIDRIEVVLGPGAAVYGNKAMLGTVNIITRGSSGEPRLEGYAAVGAEGDERGAVRYAASHGEWHERLTAQLRRQTLYDPPHGVATDIVSATAEAGYRPAPGDSVVLEAGVTDGRVHVIATGSQLYPFQARLAYAKADLHWGLGGAAAPAGELAVTAYWNGGELSSRVFPPANDQKFRATFHTPVLEATHLLRYRLLDLPMQLRWGGEARLNILKSTITSDEESLLNLAAFASNEVQLDAWRLSAGARLDRQTGNDPIVSPRFSVVFVPSEGQQIRLALNAGYNNPALVQFFSDFEATPGVIITGNRDLRPERVWHGELGYSATVQRWLRLFANGFVYRLSNYLAIEPTSQGAVHFTNHQPINGYGGETGVQATLAPGMSCYANYALLRLEPQGDFPYRGPNLGSPAHKVGGGVDLTLASGLYVTVDGQFFGASAVDRVPATPIPGTVFQTTPLEPFLMLNARLGFHSESGADLSLAATNLLDDRTRQFPGGETPQRRVMLTLSWLP